MFHPTLSKSGRFFFAPIIKFCEYLGNHHPEILLHLRYRFVFKKKLNLKNPQDLNEKIIWSKLYSDTSRWVELADKYKVREYVRNLGLEEILVKLYAVWYSVDEVNFDTLPDKFIIKANNGDGKGTHKIIDKTALTTGENRAVLKLIKRWLSLKNIGALHAEPQYKKIKPCVIAEEVLYQEGGLIDYKFWCFNGKCEYVLVCTDRTADGSGAKTLTYDMDWNVIYEASNPTQDYQPGTPIPKPANLNAMKNIAEILSKGFPQVRIDLYNIDGKIYFGEMTFTSSGGFNDDYSPEFLQILGNKFSIQDYKRKK